MRQHLKSYPILTANADECVLGNDEDNDGGDERVRENEANDDGRERVLENEGNDDIEDTCNTAEAVTKKRGKKRKRKTKDVGETPRPVVVKRNVIQKWTMRREKASTLNSGI